MWTDLTQANKMGIISRMGDEVGRPETLAKHRGVSP